MLSILALVTAGVALVAVVAEKVTKKTKTKLDDKVVEWVKANPEKVAKVVLDLLDKEKAGSVPAPAPIRETRRDHR